MTSLSSFISCKPMIATPKRDRPNQAASILGIMQALGTPAMPWQREVIEVATEQIDGRPAYRTVILGVPRQCGKSSLLLGILIAAAAAGRRRSVYTAQTGFDAKRKLVDDWSPLLERSVLGSQIARVYRAAGQEAIMFRNQARIEVMANSLIAGHGRTIDGAAVIDEAFADSDDRREQAMIPAMATKASAQLWIVSTAGTEESVYLRRKVALGRQAVEDGLDRDIAYFSWGAAEDADIDDPATWYSAIPALGHTISEEVVRQARLTMTENDFRRSWLNQWTKTDERVISAAMLENCLRPIAPDGQLVFAADISLDRAVGSIVCADEHGRVELIDNQPGTTWMLDRLANLVRKHGGRVVIDGYGPAGLLGDDLERLKIPVVKYATRDLCYASNALYDALINQTIQIRPHTKIDESCAAARKKPVGSSWLWSRADPAADLTPLLAMTIAYHAAKHRPEAPKSRPMVL